MNKIFTIILISFSFLLFSITPIFANAGPTYVSFINPVRGPEGWPLKTQSPLDLPKLQYQLATSSAFPITWLLRFDALNDATMAAFFKNLSKDSSQSLGAFLEVTPNLTKAAQVEYPPGEYMMAANRIFLSGYSQQDRLKLIDAYMDKFFAEYGYYPLTVGAWHIDSFSLNYLNKKYSVLSAVICDEQYSTDNYRLWGGYLGSPYSPNKYNFLVPADGIENKINLVITKWANRDPFNFYGLGRNSLYSFQVNDYTQLGLRSDYFSKLLDIYSQNGFNEFTQVNIGIENDYEISNYISEIKASYEELKNQKVKNNLEFISSLNFANWFLSRYQLNNPPYFFQVTDPVNKEKGTTFWYQNQYYRIGLKSVEGNTEIIDFRLYNQKEAEEHYLTPNNSRLLYAEINPLVDTVKYPDFHYPLPINLESAKVSYDYWQLTFENEDKKLQLLPQKIIYTNFNPPTLNTSEIEVKKETNQITWNLTPKIPFNTSKVTPVIVFLGVLIYFLSRRKFGILIGILFGSISLLTVMNSGFVFPYGLGLWGPNGHDAIFHLSLSEHFAKSPLSLSHPQFTAHILTSYHFAFDWILGSINRLSTIPQLSLYFRYIPLLMITLIVLSLSKLLTLWHYTKAEKVLSYVFVFLTGSLGFIPSLFLKQNIFNGESVFWANQSVSVFLNPPLALSLLFLITFLVQLEQYQKNKSFIRFIALVFTGAILVQIKIYAFILLILALSFSRQYKLITSLTIVGLIFILPSLGFKDSPFTLSPFWFVRSMFEAFDRLPFPRLAAAWQVYEVSQNWIKLTLVYFIGLIVFYTGNLGIRLIGLYHLLTSKNETLAQRIVVTITFIGLIIPLLLIQKINPWNTIQFMYYSLFFLGIFTAKQTLTWVLKIKNKLLLVLVVLILAIFSLSTTIGTLRDYLTSQSSSRISLTELRALDKLKNSERGVVISPVFDPLLSRSIPNPKPLYAYVSTAYISAISGQPEYLSDTINLDITGFNYQQALKNIARLYHTRDSDWVKKFLSENKIKYVYETPLEKLDIHPREACLSKIFDSGEVNLYKYSCND